MQVIDTGHGIEPHALPHLFEPFFSTKERWGGTGLGLSSAYGIVKQSGGFIWVESQVDQGTAITILLPAVAESQPAARGPEPKAARVRLVEDDDGVRDLLVGVLQHYGYTVEAFASAEAALADEGSFDLLLSDVLLPGMNGPELAREVRQRHPGVPVLLMSGDTGHVVDPRELDAGGFLHKPFSARTLATRVEELLRAKKPSS
jgi:two-component system cell cycle sensor histidine kinase/response regulator CckA